MPAGSFTHHSTAWEIKIGIIIRFYLLSTRKDEEIRKWKAQQRQRELIKILQESNKLGQQLVQDGKSRHECTDTKAHEWQFCACYEIHWTWAITWPKSQNHEALLEGPLSPVTMKEKQSTAVLATQSRYQWHPTGHCFLPVFSLPHSTSNFRTYSPSRY